MRKLLITLIIMALAINCFGLQRINYGNVSNPRALERLLRDRIGTLDSEVDDLQALSGGVLDNIGTGDIFYVDSGVAADLAGTSWATAHDTLQDGVDACADNNGDVIYVAQGHAETIASAAALDFNKAGITVVGIGNGEDQPEISMISLANATVQISAADVMLYNLRFLGNFTTGITECLDITANGDGAIIFGCEFRETTYDKELLIMITLTPAADEIVIVGNRFIGIDGGDDSVAINMEGASDQTVIANNYFYGDWSDYVIKNGGASISMLIENNVINNLDTGEGKLMSFDSSSTGSVVGNRCYGNGGTFAFVGAAMAMSPDNVFMETEVVTRTFEQMFGPFTGATGGGQGTTIYADIVLAQTDLDAIIADFTDYYLDHLVSAAAGTGDDPDHVADNSILAYLMSDDATADVNSYDNTTMSLEALNVDLDAIIVLAGTDIPASFTTLTSAMVALSDEFGGYVGTNAGTTTTTPIVTLLSGFGDDYFNKGWSMIITHNVNADGTAPEGQIRDITDYTSSSGTFTLGTALGSNLETDDKVMVKRTEELELDMPTVLGSAGTVRYVDSGASSGDSTGLTWENAYDTLALAEAASSAGDVIYVADGHNENLGATAEIDVANLQVIGLGEGDGRPLFDYDSGATELTLSAAGIVLKNLRFRPGAEDIVAGIVVGNDGDGVLIEKCAFVEAEGAGEEFRDCITVGATAVGVTIKDCTYENSTATAAEVDHFVHLGAGTIADVSVIGCEIYGTFFVCPIWSNTVCTNVLIKDNIISNTTSGEFCIEFTTTASGVIANNLLYSNSYATMLDPGSLMCIGNLGTDAIDQQGIAMPISAETTDVGGVADGSNLERLEYLQQLTNDAIAFFDVGTGSIFYVDNAIAGSTGIDWANAVATIDDAVNLCTHDRGDFIFVAPGHVEDLGTTDPDCDQRGITVIGLGKGEQRPVLSWDTTSDIFTIDGDDIAVYNLVFHANVPDIVIGIDITANSENAIIENCLFNMKTEGTHEFLIAINVGADCDNLVIRNCEFFQGGGNATEAILFAGTCDYAVIEDNKIFGLYSTACIYGDATGAGVMLVIRDNILYNGDITVGLNTEPVIELKADTTGFIINNTCITNETSPGKSIVAADCYLAGNTYTETEGIAGSRPIGKSYALDALAALGVSHVGKILYVDSGETSSVENGMTWGTATDTLEEAIALCTTDVGDVIFVAPGHTETMGAGQDEVDLDKNNVTVIGLGVGDARPLFDYTATTTGAFAISGNHVTVRNLRFHANITGVNEAIEVEAGALSCHIIDCMFDLEAPGTDDFTECIDSTGAASDELHVIGCSFYMGEGTCNAAISFKDSDHAVIKDNIMYGDYAIANINQVTTASNHITIENNVLFNGTIGGDAGLNEQPGIEVLGTTSGVIRYNHIGTNLGTKAASIVAAHCYLFENYYNQTDSSAATGGIIGTAAGDD